MTISDVEVGPASKLFSGSSVLTAEAAPKSVPHPKVFNLDPGSPHLLELNLVPLP